MLFKDFQRDGEVVAFSKFRLHAPLADFDATSLLVNKEMSTKRLQAQHQPRMLISSCRPHFSMKLFH
jgi:hypothetical protein